MSLLPRTKDLFRCTSYWDELYTKRTKALEWYASYNQLCGLLHKYCKTANRVLMVGCGDSTLSSDMYDIGYHDIVNIDSSGVIIRQMVDRNSKRRPQMTWLKMDVMKMTFTDEEFHAVIDKGTLDAQMTDASAEVRSNVTAMFKEISRVLRVAGRYICISLLQEHILAALLDFFMDLCWHIRIHKVEHTDGMHSHYPVFVIICTKFKKLPTVTSSILEVSAFEGSVKRCTDREEVISFVEEIQYYGTVQHQLSQTNVQDKPVTVQLYGIDIDQPRYTLHIVDGEENPQKPFAIFIVPQGREVEWMFSTEAGHRDLCSSASFTRLVIVTLNPMHTYTDMETVKGELSSKVMELAPKGLDPRVIVPFLSQGDDIGTKTCVRHGKSELSGEFVVQDVLVETEMFRRLTFLDNLYITQSEVRLCPSKKDNAYVVDKTYIPRSDYVTSVVASLAFLHDNCARLDGDLRVLMLGLGGGTLPSLIHDRYPNVYMKVAEIDEVVVAVARELFDLPQTDRLTVIVDDGLNVIKSACDNGERYDVLIVDVDNKDTVLGVTAPPPEFMHPDILSSIHTLVEPRGVFALNLSCKNKDIRQTALDSMKGVFNSMFVSPSDHDINEIVYGLTCDCETCAGVGRLEGCLTKMNAVARQHIDGERDIFDLTEFMSKLERL